MIHVLLPLCAGVTPIERVGVTVISNNIISRETKEGRDKCRMLQPSSNDYREFLEDDPNKDTDKAICSHDDIHTIPFTEAKDPSSFQSWKVDNMISNELDTHPLLNTS